MRVLIFFLILSIIVRADFVQSKYLKSMNVLNLYPRNRLLLGVNFGLNRISLKTDSYLPMNKKVDNKPLEEFLIANNFNDTYSKGDGSTIQAGFFIDYWMYKSFGILLDVGYSKLYSENNGTITLRRTDTQWNVATAESNDKWSFSVSNIYLNIAPKINFLNFFIFSGIGINIPINSEFNFYSELLSGEVWGHRVKFVDENNNENFIRDINKSIDNLKKIYLSYIGGLGVYFPVNKKIWVIPQLKISKTITTPFNSEIKYYVKLRAGKEDAFEKDRILALNTPETQWLQYTILLNIIYRF